jgi:hypothetical protein
MTPTARPDEAWMDLADQVDRLLAVLRPRLGEEAEREQPHREVMEVLPVAVGGLTDADAVAPPEHSPDLRHHPFR